MDYKQIIVIRTDLGMSVGKMIVQGCHASMLASRLARDEDIDAWMKEGYRKIICEARSLEDLKAIAASCEEKGVSCCSVEDLGLTEIEPGTLTALGIGPAKNSEINKVTKRLEKLDIIIPGKDEIKRMTDLGIGFAESSEFWRKMYHLEHRHTSFCCDLSESVKFLEILEKGGTVTKRMIKDALFKARETYRDLATELNNKDDDIDELKADLFAANSTIAVKDARIRELERRIRCPEEFEEDLGFVEVLNDEKA